MKKFVSVVAALAFLAVSVPSASARAARETAAPARADRNLSGPSRAAAPGNEPENDIIAIAAALLRLGG